MLQKIFSDPRLKTIKTIGIMAFVGVLVIHNIIRPYHLAQSETAKHWYGILPNFFAGLGLCITFYIYHLPGFKNLNLNRQRRLVAAFLISFLGLTLWEYLQHLLHRPFDIEDIWMSLAGALIGAISIIAFEKKPSPGVSDNP